MLKTGIRGRCSVQVAPENTAATYGSGTLQVFATPAMIALMERTCLGSVSLLLDEGCGTVGTLINVQHTAPTPVGMTVTCESELVEIDGRRLVFHVRCMDEKGPIGEGTHERFIIYSEKFQAKADAKRG